MASKPRTASSISTPSRALSRQIDKFKLMHAPSQNPESLAQGNRAIYRLTGRDW